VTGWRPSAAECRQYADYALDERTHILNQKTYDIGGVVHRSLFFVQRIPSQKVFRVYYMANLTPRERRQAEAAAALLPRGYWAEFRDIWYRKRWPSGRVYFAQTITYAAPDPFAQLELEMLIDLERSQQSSTEVHQ